MLVTQCRFPHIRKLDSAFAATVHELITVRRMEFSGGNNFCQLLHIDRLYVDDVEGLVLDSEVPKVDSQVICADVGLAV